MSRYHTSLKKKKANCLLLPGILRLDNLACLEMVCICLCFIFFNAKDRSTDMSE